MSSPSSEKNGRFGAVNDASNNTNNSTEYCAPWEDCDQLLSRAFTTNDNSQSSERQMTYEIPWDVSRSISIASTTTTSTTEEPTTATSSVVDGRDCCGGFCDNGVSYNEPWDNSPSNNNSNNNKHYYRDSKSSSSIIRPIATKLHHSHQRRGLPPCRCHGTRSSFSSSPSPAMNTSIYPDWWRPTMRRREAENLLRKKTMGSFVIRASETCSGHMSLSICGPNTTIIHIQLTKDDEDNYILGQCSHPFKSIYSMLSYYSSNPLPIKGAPTDLSIQLDGIQPIPRINTGNSIKSECSFQKLCHQCRLPVHSSANTASHCCQHRNFMNGE